MEIIKESLTFDDVLLEPQYSDIETRSGVSLFINICGLKFSHPIIPANMKTITGKEMCEKTIESGGLAILNRFISIDEQLNITNYIINKFGNNNFAISVGIKEEDKNNLKLFIDKNVKIFCIDIAHGDSLNCINMIKYIKKLGDYIVIAGNVATGNGAERLWRAGADIIKVGVGSGSLCTTRIETGNGKPQLSSLIEIAEVSKRLQLEFNKKFSFISDGGIKNSGDIVKALLFADMVMIGNMFSGCDECPCNLVNMNGKLYKEYAGSSTYKTSHIEGVVTMVPYKGAFNNILTKILEGIKSGLSYQGCRNLTEVKDNPILIKISNAGLIESHSRY